MKQRWSGLTMRWIALMGALSCGCQFAGDQVPQSAGSAAAGAAHNGEQVYWRAAPVAMRLYPSTRYIREEDNPILEARIELFDSMGDSVKGAGELHLELYTGDRDRQRDIGQRLYAWRVALKTIEDQRTYYDPVTRAYLFRLKVDNLQIATRMTTVQATLIQPDGSRLEASMAMTPQRPVRITPPAPVPGK